MKKFLKVSVISMIIFSMVAIGSAYAKSDKANSENGYQSQLGLQVNNGGLLVKDKVPYHGIGVNYFNLFYRTLTDPTDTSYHEGLQILAEHDIPFVRFMASGYWPSENRLYFEDKEKYFELFDNIVAAAEEYNIGLIPSFFWYTATVPDLMDEPRNQWGNPDSKTHEFMKTYIREVVTRYKDSPAIWGWEMGNEYNLEADLPNAADHRPPVWPQLGTRLERSADDDLTSDMIRNAYKTFAEEVRKYDPNRVIISGNSVERQSAWHQRMYNSWEQDTEAQYKEMLLDNHPDPMNMLSMHLYELEEHRFSRNVTADELVGITMDIAKKAKKPLFIGEFGSNEAEGHEAAREKFETMLAAIENNRVPLAAMWVYDYSGQEGSFNVTDENNRAYQLELLQEVNHRIQKNYHKQ